MLIVQDVTELLLAWQDGDGQARVKLAPLIHAELRRIAERCMGREQPGHTLQPTALVNEAYLRLIRQERANWRSRTHFFAVAAQQMRRILVDHARAQAAAKRGGNMQKLPLDEAVDAFAPPVDVDLLALEDALATLESLAPEQCRIVELRFFAGLSVEETAEALAISPATVHRRWRSAKAFLQRELTRE